MHLEKLEINGFKSFADKTALKILPGITAIVGPNGCGKTNIVDAISWVLGSQSPRRLRGSKMEDVIFSGSESRPAVGFAEVSLTFDNSAGRLPVEYSEVSFTRRLYRSGESEYLINGGSCRLKDIQNLILGTGLGNRSYSLIEQGRLEWIINSQPEERRGLLEEAAGISKFRAHKMEALRKLEHVGNNLLRVEDIVKEVRRQLRQAEKQAVQARRYGELRDRFRGLETQLAALELKKMREEETRLESETAEWERKAGENRSASEEIEAESDRLQEEIRELRGRFEQRRGRAFGAEAELATSRRQIALNRERVLELKLLRKQARAEIESLEASLSDSAGERDRLQKELEALRESNHARADRIAAVEKKEAEVRGRLADIESGFNRLRSELVESSRVEIRARNEYSSLEAGEKEVILRARRLEVELERLRDREAELGKEASAAREKSGGLEAEAGELQRRLAEKKEEAGRLGEQLAALKSEREELSAAIREKTARLELLEGWERSRDDGREGVEAIRREVVGKGGDGNGVVGVLADLIEVDPGGEKTVAAAWGDNLRALLVRDWKTATAVVDCLRSRGGTGIRLVVAEELNRLEEERGARPEITPFPCRLPSPWHGLTGPLIAALGTGSAPPGAPPSASALAAADDCAFPAPAVISWLGPASPAVEVVSRKKKIEELAAEKAALAAKTEGSEHQIETAERNRDAVVAIIRRLEKESREAELSLMFNRGELERQISELERIRSQQKGLQGELSELKNEGEEIRRRRSEMEVVLRRGTGREEELAGQAEEWQRRKSAEDEKVAAIAAELVSLKIDLASSREKEDSLAARLEAVEKGRDESRTVLAGRRLQLDGSEKRGRELEEENRRLEETVAGLESEIRQLSPEVESLATEIAGLEARLREKEEQRHSLRPGWQRAQEELNARRTKLAEVRVRLEGLFGRIREKYDLDLEAVAPAAEPVDTERAGQELDKIKDEMSRMGMVNLAALEGKENLEERLAHLTGQRDDLVGARADLESAIRKINVTAREKLEATYNAVRENFRSLFKVLFSGGKADLILDNEKDILESGLEIVAQPPGKKLANLSLLSGGEKALTTIALIFALFRIQPSPFYILDEMDAPLDESNIGRFVRLLREFSAHSQFVIITHNKRTISEADILYGITMEERGVSKVVSVKLADN